MSRSIWVDIDLSQVDESDLIDELKDRYLNERERLELVDILNDEGSKKIALFLKVKDKYSLLELEEMFQEKFSHTPCKEQLTLNLTL